MPNDWRVIKSNDIRKVMAEKLDKIASDHEWEMPKNTDFYNWILS